MTNAELVLGLVFLVGGYLCGSIPFGLLVGRLKGIDVRKAGSGNIGATNVGRVLGRGFGMAVFGLDVAKGLLPVILAGRWLVPAAAGGGPQGALASHYLMWVAVALACILGHVFPVWLGFKGGKGVATSLGALLGIYPFFAVPGLVALGMWGVVVAVTRYVSAASVAGAVTFPIVFAMAAHLRAGQWGGWDRLWPMYAFAILIAVLVVYRHRSNLQRLLAGTESKIGSSRGPVA